MAFHHVALATHDTEATHRFYTEAMGFRLVKIVTGRTPGDHGWSKHFFFDTGAGGLIAFWELHDERIGEGYRTNISRDLGLPEWVNHLAFDAPTMEDLEGARERWRSNGLSVAQIDHGWCVSIYATDPNGIMVEFCHTTRPFTDNDAVAAHERLLDPSPPLEPAPAIVFYDPEPAPAPV